MADRFHVVTGGPGSGKTSLLEALSGTGLPCMAEAGRAIIRDEVATGGTALPWADRAAFADRMLAREIESHDAAAALDGPVLFDRGIPDVIGYLRLCGLAVPRAMLRAAEQRRYNSHVFLAPHWRAIYVQDAERRQDAAEAAATAQAMADSWTECGYRLVRLPLAPVEVRAAFVRAHLRRGGRA